MENTLENKSKFFAKYYVQKVAKSPLLNDELPNQRCYPELALNPNNVFYLELTPLSQISDEDAIEVAKLIDNAPFFTHKKWEIKRVDNEPASYLKVFSEKSHHYYEIDFDGYLWYKDEYTAEMPPFALPNYLDAYDYLRSKGYALSFNGLSVEKQIEYGWIKLKTDEYEKM